MAVFTPVNVQDLAPLLKRFDLGCVVSLQAISEGIENTNYFLTTQSGEQAAREWVFTLFENLDADDLPYFCRLTQHLAEAGFAVPAPLKDVQGESLFELNARWGVIVPKLHGRSKVAPDEQACAAVGRWLARMHRSLVAFDAKRPLVRNLAWVKQHYVNLEGRLTDGERDDLAGYISRYEQYQQVLQVCPQGTVHGDLFKDNVLFDANGEISGVIDFYQACDASLLFDLAVVANDWCTDKDGRHIDAKLFALRNAYQTERAWSVAEEQAWPYALELAALRFWVSRLATYYAPGYQQRSVEGETVKDPEEMRRILHGLAAAKSPV
ncbi:MAG: homoserine kinase [Oleiphilaceae bacterium]|nr:homoserine kinase [Oleiphilaceae bacterium]